MYHKTKRKAIAFIVIIVLAMLLFLILVFEISRHNNAVSGDTSQQTDDLDEESEVEELPAADVSATEAVTEDDSRLQISVSEETDEENSAPTEQEETNSGRRQWQVYIQQDMPEPFAEVLEQYEEYLNADNQNLNDKSVGDKIYNVVDGEWRYVYDELCWELNRENFEGDEPEDLICYSLTDLTGDGFPELIMGYHFDDETYPNVIYYYSETEGVKMECWSRYFAMTLYEGGIIEYVSGGVNYTITYVQFRQDTEAWNGLDCFLIMNVIDGEDVRGGPIYYREGDEEDFYSAPEYAITEEEFRRITDGYTQKPVELEWTSLISG